MKRFAPLVVAMLALAAVPVALGDTAPSSTHHTRDAGARVQRIQQRLQRIEARFAKRCGTDSSTAPQQCVTFAQHAEQRLGTLDTKLQALIQKRQQAGKDVAPLTVLDTELQALQQKVHAWLGS